MAEFCSICASYLGEKECDYNLFQIALDLEPGYSEPFVCGGCNIRAVHKDVDGLLYLAKTRKGEVALEQVKIEALMI